jgi:hypothetical protein
LELFRDGGGCDGKIDAVDKVDDDVEKQEKDNEEAFAGE